MLKRLRLTRRFPAAMTKDACLGLTRFRAETGLAADEELTFALEPYASVTDTETFGHRLRPFKAEFEELKA